MTAVQMLTVVAPSPGVDVLPALRAVDAPRELAALVEELSRHDPTRRPPSAAATAERLRGTGLVIDEASALEEEVEVFDQVPPLPAGWSERGPDSSADQDDHPPAQPSGAGRVEVARPHEDRLGSVLPWVGLMLLGALLIVTAMLLAWG